MLNQCFSAMSCLGLMGGTGTMGGTARHEIISGRAWALGSARWAARHEKAFVPCPGRTCLGVPRRAWAGSGRAAHLATYMSIIQSINLFFFFAFVKESKAETSTGRASLDKRKGKCFVVRSMTDDSINGRTMVR